jgi:aspartate/methionine/tyrosine aminotransferase
MQPANKVFSGFRDVPKTGVIYVMAEAARAGYRHDDPTWVNLGQGQPEICSLDGAPPRIESIHVHAEDLEYAPINGPYEVRAAIADFYNRNYRKGLGSKYSTENVCVAPGGRAALTRIAASLGNINLGHFLPDYTAYEELLGVFKCFNPIPILLDPERGYEFSAAEFRNEVLGRGLGAVLLSNPCNPTGKLVDGQILDQWISISRDLKCTMIFDEFYSHYIWQGNPNQVQRFSAAQFVENVDKDPVVILDGLTKNWRYPGLRVSWIVGPKDVIAAVTSAGSFLDGGAAHPIQNLIPNLLSEQNSNAEAAAIQRCFREKRQVAIAGVGGMGIELDREPDGTFYLWGNLRNLPEGINTGLELFQAALKEKVITVPGQFFDINPGGRRSGRPSRFEHHMRFSFGAKLDSLQTGLTRLQSLISNFGQG